MCTVVTKMYLIYCCWLLLCGLRLRETTTVVRALNSPRAYWKTPARVGGTSWLSDARVREH